MAQHVATRLVDDLDGTHAAETVTFGLGGHQYEIDLSDQNAAKLRDALATYVAAARRAGRTGRSRTTAQHTTPTRSGSSDRELTAAIREWARQNGHQVSDRGRIPNSVTEAYQQRGSAAPESPEAKAAPKAEAEAVAAKTTDTKAKAKTKATATKAETKPEAKASTKRSAPARVPDPFTVAKGTD